MVAFGIKIEEPEWIETTSLQSDSYLSVISKKVSAKKH